MYVVKVATHDEYIRCREKWDSLAEEMKYPTIFCTWEWVHAWWNHFGKACELVVLFIYREDELNGILPLYLESPRSFAPSANRRLGFCGNTRVYPDHLDIICAEDEAMACLDAAFNYLFVNFRRWDALCLPYLAKDSNLLSWLEKNRHRVAWHVKEQCVAPYIGLDGTIEDYLSSLNSRKRYNILSRRRKLVERHGMKYYACEHKNLEECLEILFRLHNERAGKKGIDTSFGNADILNFHRDLLHAVIDKGWAWIRLLQAADKAIAASYSFVFGSKIHFYQMGHDPDWHSLGPGTTIIYETLQEAFACNYQEFNFLEGDEQYKFEWTKKQRVMYTATVYQNSFRGRLLGIIDRLLGIIKRVKKSLRRIYKDKLMT
jgi:CelD/BcsL family acetyltransferase involved in cellulose biosynthesis